MDNVPNSSEPGRKFWWQIPGTWRCPVIGTCLTMAEQRSILKRAKVPLAGLGDHGIHGLLVQSGDTDSKMARRVHRYLERKYRSEIQTWGTYDEPALVSLWEEQLRCGQIDALLWIAATHPSLSELTTNRIYADVHMLMHQQGEVVRQELQQVERLRAEKQKLGDKLNQSWARQQELTQTMHALEQENDALRRAASTREQPGQMDQLASLRAQLKKAERRYEAQAVVIERLQAEKDKLDAELASMNRLNLLMRAELQSVLATMAERESECQDCPDYHLCGRRVLLVGGVTRLRAIYRQLVADAGGEFKHHNGGKSGGTRALEGVISWADIVLCPVDINSHHACLNVKAICKKMDKPYHMMSSSGVSSVARVLAAYGQPAAGEQQQAMPSSTTD